MPISPSGRYKKRQHWGASMMRKLAFLCLVPILAVPFSVQALGLGDIRLHSALNQPLDAEIELISATDGELESLKATVASMETFAEYDLERPDFLDTLIFSVTQDASGRSILKVSSRTPVTEPVVTLLIEANWSRGQLLREYTVLLDPPLFAPAEDAPRYVQPAPPPVSIQPEPAPELRFEQPPPAALPAAQEPAPFTQPEATVTTPAPAPSYPTASYPTGDDYGPVVRNQTLWSIASRLRPDASVDIHQMMIALFRENPEAFAGNINILKEGAILRIPDIAAIRGISQAEALADARQQIDDWRVAKGQLRLVAPEDTDVMGLAFDRGTEDTFSFDTDASDTDFSTDSTVAGTTGDDAFAGDTDRLINIEDPDLAALQDQTSDLDTLPEDTEISFGDLETTTPGVDLEGSESEPATDDFESLADTGDDTEGAVSGSDDITVADAGDTEVQTPRAQGSVPSVVAPAPVDESSLMDSLFNMLGNTWVWIAGGLSLILLMGVVFVRRRMAEGDLAQTFDGFDDEAIDEALLATSDTAVTRRVEPSHTDSIVVEESTVAETDLMEETLTIKPDSFADQEEDEEAPIPAAEDTRATSQIASPDTAGLDSTMALQHGDPLAEADFHMAYGLYDQAAEIVQKASVVEPDRRDLKMKLLEIFFVWGNRDSFVQEAKALKSTIGDGSDSDWDKVVIMGKQICPDDALFAGAAAASPGGEVDLELEPTIMARAEVDFATIADDDIDKADASVDLDLGEITGSTRISEGSDLEQFGAADEEDVIDFDLGDKDQSAAADIFDLGELEKSPSPEATIRERVESLTGGSEPDVADMTAELELDDLGLDLDLGETADTPALDEADAPIGGDLTAELHALAEQREAEEAFVDTAVIGPDDNTDTSIQTGLTQIPEALTGDEAPPGIDETMSARIDLGLDETGILPAAEVKGEATRLATDLLGETDIRQLGEDIDLESTAEILAESADSEDVTAELPAMVDDEIDLDLEDLAAELDEGDTRRQRALGVSDDTMETVLADDTVEQELASSALTVSRGADVEDSIDLDIGELRGELEDDSPTDTARISPADLGLPDESEAETMSEIGTKLDLARAYMDMGDPHGARSILQEVLEEGTDNQKQEAQQLLENLP